MNPTVSVVMPAYNGEKYIGEAIRSILDQSYLDFELIVIDDGSTDDTVRIAASFRDSRIRIVSNDANYGISYTLNRGMREARGRYVAHLDCDDVSMPERLARQVDCMEKNQELGGCGTWYYRKFRNFRFVEKCPGDPEYIKAALLFHDPICHSSFMFDRGVVEKHHLTHDSKYKYAHDYDIFIRLASVSKIGMVQAPLVEYRSHAGQVTRAFRNEKVTEPYDLMGRELMRFGMGKLPATFRTLLLDTSSAEPWENVNAMLARIEKLFQEVVDANAKVRVFEPRALRRAIAREWLLLASIHANYGFNMLVRYQLSQFSRELPIEYFKDRWIKFSIKCLLRKGNL